MIPAYYLLKVIVCSGILYSYYWFALRNRAFHQWNRFYLLAITILSICLPLLKFNFHFESNPAINAVRYISLEPIDASVIYITKRNTAFSLSTEGGLFLIYAIVSVSILWMLVRAFKGILNILNRNTQQQIRDVILVKADDKGTPFTFFQYLVWNRQIELGSQIGRQILRHEMVHIQQKHTWDKVFILLLLVPFWANPFFWWIRKELSDLHEFIADKKAVESGSVEDLSRMILNALYPQQAYLFTSPFFQSSIRRRLQMFTIKNQKINYMSRILVLPLLFILSVAFTFKASKNYSTSFQQQNPQKENETFSRPLILNDTFPTNRKAVLVQEIRKDTINRPANSKAEPNVIIDSMNYSNQKIIVENLKKEPNSYNAVDRNALINEIDTIPNSIKAQLKVFTKLEVEPKFDGDWSAFLQKNLNPLVPIDKGAPAGNYTVIAQFIVDEDGNISDLKALTKHGYGMEEEVLKMMRKSPNWIPGQQNGKKVTAYRKQPVTFVISEEEDKIIAATDKLYIGIDNHIKLNFGNVKPENLIVTISDGAIINKGAFYVARVNSAKSITIKVFRKDKNQLKELDSRTFAADVIPDGEDGKKIVQAIKNFNN